MQMHEASLLALRCAKIDAKSVKRITQHESLSEINKFRFLLNGS